MELESQRWPQKRGDPRQNSLSLPWVTSHPYETQGAISTPPAIAFKESEGLFACPDPFQDTGVVIMTRRAKAWRGNLGLSLASYRVMSQARPPTRAVIAKP